MSTVANSSTKCDGVLIVGFGGPTAPDEVRPFLDRVLKGRPVPRERYEEVVHHYELLGGRSPYNELTMRQADELRKTLREGGSEMPIAVGMRNTPPFLDQAVRELASRGVRRALGFIMAAFRCEASWERYQENVREAQEHVGAGAPDVIYPEPWHGHPLFIEATTSRVREALERLAGDERARAHLIFTAHSIPHAMAAGAPYVAELRESAQLVARRIGFEHWVLAFQSRGGSPREPWLEPDIVEVLRRQGAGVAVVTPIGFLCDHVEVLYDLDIEAAQVARVTGIRMTRAATVSDHPKFIELMASVARAHL
ncbi:MAG: ferrochelatase [Candidatus Binataceae bacterium]